MNEMYFKYHQQLQEQQNTGVNVPSAPPTLNQSHYGLLLSGCPADEENGVTEIPPIFHIVFLKKRTFAPGLLVVPFRAQDRLNTTILFVMNWSQRRSNMMLKVKYYCMLR
jgi:hypothetical protein